MTDPEQGEGFFRLLEFYEHRVLAADMACAQGLKVVGIVGSTVPAELVWAAGCFPLTLSGLPGETAAIDHLMEPFFEPECRFIFDGLMREAFGRLALVIIPRTSDQYNKLYLYLRELKRSGRGDHVPPIVLYDLLHTSGERSRRYGLARTQELRTCLAKLAGRAIGDRELRNSIHESNNMFDVMTEFSAKRIRRPASVLGSEALVALSASRFMERKRYVAALSVYIAARTDALAARPRVMIRGFALNHVYLHAALERAGAIVVSEDDWWGARAFETRIAEIGDPLEAIFDRYFLHTPGPRVDPSDPRERWFKDEVVRAGIEGVVLYNPPYDDVSGWTIPADRQWLAANGIDSIVVREDAAKPGLPALEATLATFVKQLESNRVGNKQ